MKKEKNKQKRKREMVEKERNGNERVGLGHGAQNDFPDQAYFLCDHFFDNNKK